MAHGEVLLKLRRKGNLVHLDQLMDLRVLVVIVSLRLQLQRIQLLILVGTQRVLRMQVPVLRKRYTAAGLFQKVLRFFMVQRRVILFIRLLLLLL